MKDSTFDFRNTHALRILEGGLLERAKVGVVDDSTWADSAGRILTDSGREEWVNGWNNMTGCLRVLVDETGRDAYLIH